MKQSVLRVLGFCIIAIASAAVALAGNRAAQEELKAALRDGDPSRLEAAIADGADPDFGSPPPIVIASTRGDIGVIQQLIDAGADPNGADTRGRSALVAAISKSHHDAMKLLIEAGADVNLPESSPGRSPLQLVIDEAPSIRSMEILLNAGADINQTDQRGESALASAAFMNRSDALQLLLERGADLGVVNNQGISPLEWARRQGNHNIIELLRRAGMTK